MATLKIVFQAGSKQIVLYGQGMKQMWQVETHVLERLGKEQSLKLDTAQFRKYWIDEEGDRVEIMNDVDFDFFLKRFGTNRTAKIYFEAYYPGAGETPRQPEQQPQSSTSSPPRRDTENLSIHSTVECDICKTKPLRGFRYKCLECVNFDVCMKCEGEMKHPLHLMIRIPNSEPSTLEKISPITSNYMKKRYQKRHAAAVAAAAAAAAAAGNGGFCSDAQQGEGKSRHHRHHRRHCATGSTPGPGIWSHFYDMMQDLAEGGAVQTDDAAARETTPEEQQETAAPAAQQQETSAPAAKQQETSAQTAPSAQAKPQATEAPTVNSQSKETNTSPDRSSTNSAAGAQTPGGSTAPPSFENLQNLIDPHFMKAGIQILNNFSEMFGKILDPVVAVDVTRTNSEPESVVIDIDLTSGSSRASAATPPPTPKEATAEAQGTSVVGSGVVTPMETEVSPPTPPATAAESQPRSHNSQSEENDWTMIDNSPATTSAEASANAAAAAAVVAATAPPLDFAKLSQQLQSHIENEMKGMEQSRTAPAAGAMPTFNYPNFSSVIPPAAVAPTPVAPTPVAPTQVAPTPVASAPIVPSPVAPSPVTPTPVPTPRTPEVAERRAVAVFHPDPRINSAVHAMTAMGFSNEGAALTQLLESVNGSIPLALDLMSAAQR